MMDSILRRRWPVLLVVLLLLTLPSPVSAQFNAAIQGTVVDSQGLVLPGATVRITNVTTGVKREVLTTPDGVYRAPSLAAGTYTIEVELDGFNKAVRQAVNVGISETVASRLHAGVRRRRERHRRGHGAADRDRAGPRVRAASTACSCRRCR